MNERSQNPVNSGDVTRGSALEKEILRLKSINKKQSSRLYRLKKWTIFQLFFFLLLFIMFAFYGILQWPGSSEVHQTSLSEIKPDTFFIRDTVTIYDASFNAELKSGEDHLLFKVPHDGILYSIQIGAYTEIDMTPYKLNLLSLYQYSYQELNQFTVGLFQDYNDAEQFRQLIIRMGFADAFVIATLHGRRISLQEAFSIQSQTQE